MAGALNIDPRQLALVMRPNVSGALSRPVQPALHRASGGSETAPIDFNAMAFKPTGTQGFLSDPMAQIGARMMADPGPTLGRSIGKAVSTVTNPEYQAQTGEAAHAQWMNQILRDPTSLMKYIQTIYNRQNVPNGQPPGVPGVPGQPQPQAAAPQAQPDPGTGSGQQGTGVVPGTGVPNAGTRQLVDDRRS